jgi:hypothetical protein
MAPPIRSNVPRVSRKRPCSVSSARFRSHRRQHVAVCILALCVAGHLDVHEHVLPCSTAAQVGSAADRGKTAVEAEANGLAGRGSDPSRLCHRAVFGGELQHGDIGQTKDFRRLRGLVKAVDSKGPKGPDTAKKRCHCEERGQKKKWNPDIASPWHRGWFYSQPFERSWCFLRTECDFGGLGQNLESLYGLFERAFS